MERIEIYRNYGCLTAEKRSLYTYGAEHATAVCSDKMTVEIPEGWTLSETVSGGMIVTAPWGWDSRSTRCWLVTRPPYLAHGTKMGAATKERSKL